MANSKIYNFIFSLVSTRTALRRFHYRCIQYILFFVVWDNTAEVYGGSTSTLWKRLM